jgi:hypothetical protein
MQLQVTSAGYQLLECARPGRRGYQPGNAAVESLDATHSVDNMHPLPGSPKTGLDELTEVSTCRSRPGG